MVIKHMKSRLLRMKTNPTMTGEVFEPVPGVFFFKEN